jgi:hypothetical protein
MLGRQKVLMSRYSDAFLEACDHPILLAVDSAPKELFILSMSAS